MTPQHDPRDVESLNRSFYSSNPYEYFSMRVGIVSLMASCTSRYGAEVTVGITLGPLTIQQSPPPGALQFRDAQVESYVVTDSVVLFHHAAETLLRYFLAHLADRGCPWLEVAMLRAPSEFKSALEQMSEPGALNSEEVAWVFFGANESPDQDLVPADRWEAAVASHVELVCSIAGLLVTEAPLYNAMKHGLATQTTHGSMSLGAIDEAPSFTTNGQWIRLLTRERQQYESVWFDSTVLVDPRRYWLMTLAAVYMMKGLWSVGRSRHGFSEHVEPFISAADLNVADLMLFGATSGVTGLNRPIGVERRLR